MNKEKLFLSNKDMPKERMDNEVFSFFYVLNPHIPFYVFTPIAIAMLALSIYCGLNVLGIIMGFMVALAFWTVFEYSMHRYFFHWESEQSFFKKMMYTIHHGHHDYPNDKRLMLVHPIISVAAYLGIWGIAFLLAGHYAHPFMMGLAVCYMFYDWLHYASHNYNYNSPFFQKLKMHHLHHHYTDHDKNFGFTTFIWDYIMKTLLKRPVRKKKNKLSANNQ